MAIDLKISQKHFISGDYVETTYLYFGDNGANTSEIKLERLDSLEAPFDYAYSVDDGSTWSVIANDNSSAFYEWQPTSDQWSEIFQTPDYNARTIKIKLTDNLGATSTKIINVYRQSLRTAYITPKSSHTGYSSGYSFNFSSHTDPIHKNDAVVFEAAETWYSETQFFDVYIERYNIPGYTKIKSNVAPKALSDTWIFASMIVPNTTQTLAEMYPTNGTYRLIYIGQQAPSGTNHHIGNYAVGEWFAVSTEHTVEKYPTGKSDFVDYSSRTDIMTRVSGEKAVWLDEFPVISQFEAGKGIVVTQRNAEGRMINELGQADTNEPINYKKAYNLVIETEFDGDIDVPRTLSGYFEMESLETSGGWIAGLYYGTAYEYTISHGWNLKDGHSYQLELRNIVDFSEENKYVKPKAEIVPQYETLSTNAIKVYAVKKGESFVTSDGKDQIDEDQPGGSPFSYKFYFNLTEVIPALPVVVTGTPTQMAEYDLAVTDNEVVSIGNYPIIERGVCYSSSNSTPTIANSKVTAGRGKGLFDVSILGLTPNTYYVRAYAKNSEGQVGYGVVKPITIVA